MAHGPELMQIARRGFIAGMASLIAAPAIPFVEVGSAATQPIFFEMAFTNINDEWEFRAPRVYPDNTQRKFIGLATHENELV